MRKYLISVFCLLCCFVIAAQQPVNKPLPIKTFLALKDSTTSLDIVFLKGVGGSISVEGKNVPLFNSFFENKTAAKINTTADGNFMWQINGREFISGSYFLGDTTGCVVFQKDGKEFVNRISVEGNSFLKSQGKN